MALPKSNHGSGDSLASAWANEIALLAAGDVTVAVGGTGDYTLSAAEYTTGTLILTGTLTGNRNIIVPAEKRTWTVVQDCSGAFTLTVKTASGSGVVVANGKTAIVRCNGVDVKRVTADVTH